jgi:hypothetical protein
VGRERERERAESTESEGVFGLSSSEEVLRLRRDIKALRSFGA